MTKARCPTGCGAECPCCDLKALSAEEVAKNLYGNLFIAYEADDRDEKDGIALIADALKQAEAQGFEKGVQTFKQIASCDSCRTEGYAQAREQAAKICETPIWDALTDVREREIQKGLLTDAARSIRAMEPEK